MRQNNNQKEEAVETLVLERTTPMDALFSFIGASEQVRMVKDAGKTVAIPVIDPEDYDNDTDYLMAIPGMKEKLVQGMNAPASKCKRVPREYFNV
jgi:hypothetical protein